VDKKDMPQSDIIMIGPVRFNAQQLEVSRDGKTTRLTPVESRVLRSLVDHANTVCSVSQIVSDVFGLSNDGDTALIKAHIRHLRQKVEPDPNNPAYILTVPGEGYTLAMNPHE
jgi:DNA-binding response OmpR family regulator